MSFASVFQGGEGSQFVTETAQGANLGTAMDLPDGRRFRYTLNGGVVGVAGSLYAGVVPDADNDALAVTTAALDDKSLFITMGATEALVEQFRDGYVNVEDDAGEGKLLAIKNHAAVAGAAEGEFFLRASLPVAFAAGTTVGLTENLFSNTVIHPSPALSGVSGVYQAPIAVAGFGWSQVAGPCSVLGDGVLVIAMHVMVSDNLDGAVEDFTLTEGTANTVDDQIVGRCLTVEADTEHSIIYLQLD